MADFGRGTQMVSSGYASEDQAWFVVLVLTMVLQVSAIPCCYQRNHAALGPNVKTACAPKCVESFGLSRSNHNPELYYAVPENPSLLSCGYNRVPLPRNSKGRLRTGSSHFITLHAVRSARTNSKMLRLCSRVLRFVIVLRFAVLCATRGGSLIVLSTVLWHEWLLFVWCGGDLAWRVRALELKRRVSLWCILCCDVGGVVLYQNQVCSSLLMI